TSHRTEQQPNVRPPERAEVSAGLPGRNDLFSRQHPPAGRDGFRRLHAVNWRSIEVTPVDRPIEEFAKGRVDQLLHPLAVVIAIKMLDNVSTSDVLNRTGQVQLGCIEDTFASLP